MATITSPRIEQLQAALESGNTSALAAFWQEVAERGAPLIEPIADDERHMLVTFLWRSDESLENVTLAGGLAGYVFEKNQLTRLPNTDLWYRTYRARADVRTTYNFLLNNPYASFDEITDRGDFFARSQIDSLNPRTFVFPKDEEDPDDREWVRSVLELPAAPPQPYVALRPGVVQGQVETHRLRSAALENERRIWVYLPHGYTPEGEPYHLLVLFDGWAYLNLVPAPTILDNLLADGRIPPLVAILIGNVDRNRELPCYPPLVDFLADELMLWARKRYNITSGSVRTIIAGSSYGGLAATFAALRRPEMFGNVLSQSGSFWWKPDDDHEYEWLTRQFVQSPTLPLHLYLDVGLLESGVINDDGLSALVANRHMRNVLQAKGYELHYAEYSGEHDYLCWQGTLADGLIALIGRE